MAEEHEITSLKGLEDLRFGASYYFEGADFSSPRARGSWRFGGNYVSLPDRLKHLGGLTLQSPLECLLLRWEANRRLHMSGNVSDDLLESLKKPQSTRMLVVYFFRRGNFFAAFDDSPSSYAMFSKASDLERVHRRTDYFSADKAPWIKELLERAEDEGRVVKMPKLFSRGYNCRLPSLLSVSNEAGVSEFNSNGFCKALFGSAASLYETLEKDYGKDGEIGLLIAWMGGMDYKLKDDNSTVEVHNVILGGLEDSGLPVNVTASKPKNIYGLSMINTAAFVRDRGCMRGVNYSMSFADYDRVLKTEIRCGLPSPHPLVEVIPPGSKAGLAAKPVGR